MYPQPFEQESPAPVAEDLDYEPDVEVDEVVDEERAGKDQGAIGETFDSLDISVGSVVDGADNLPK